jgi:uncharacterized protein
MPSLSADEVIRELGLSPHPEGGWYRECFRDEAASSDGRARSTAIYFLLKAGETSHWHRIDACEIWLWHAGAPLALSISIDGEGSQPIASASILRRASVRKPSCTRAPGKARKALVVGRSSPASSLPGLSFLPLNWQRQIGGRLPLSPARPVPDRLLRARHTPLRSGAKWRRFLTDGKLSLTVSHG